MESPARINVSPAGLNQYGYEDHQPAPQETFGQAPIPADYTEVSQSPSAHECPTVHFEQLDGECPMPPDRLARKQRSFARRGGAVHSALLKSAVMASMSMSDDDCVPVNRRGSVESTISLQSLQNALCNQDTSPRKRARKGRRNSDENQNEDVDEALTMLDTLKMGSLDTRKEPLKREPPIRRVSRKTSYDSRVSEFDSEFSDWEED